MSTENRVRIVRKVGESDIEVTPTLPPMSRERALRALRVLNARKLAHQYDLVYVDTEGNPMTYASWAL